MFGCLLFSVFFRGMEENGSEGMDELIEMEAVDGKFLSDVDFFCISVGYKLQWSLSFIKKNSFFSKELYILWFNLWDYFFGKNI